MPPSIRPWKEHLTAFYHHPVSVPELFKPSSADRTITLPSSAGRLTLTEMQTAALEHVSLCPFLAELRVPGHESAPILMYFMTLQARPGAVVDAEGLRADCKTIPVAELLYELCPAGFCKTEAIFERGGVLEFCYMVAPRELNGLGLWHEAANTVVQELVRRRQPAMLLLKATPMELTTTQVWPAWADSRLSALQRLYASKLGVKDLDLAGWMWRPLQGRGAGLVADKAVGADTARARTYIR